MSRVNIRELRRILRALEARQKELDLLILNQRSGAERNLLTDANIHLLASMDSLKNIAKRNP